MEKIKVGLFIDTFYPMIDGVINVVDNYAKRLNKFCDVVVIAPIGRKEYDDSKLAYEIKRCTKRFKIFFLDYDLALPKFDKKLNKFLKGENFDIIHIHSPFSIGKLGIRYAKKHNIPVVATLHSQFKKDFYRATHLKGLTNIMLKIVMKQFNKCDECWAVNGEVAKIYYNDYKLKKYPKVQNNGTDMLPVTNLQDVENLKKKWNVQKDEKVFLFIGRLTILKNILFIVESLKILKDKGFKFKMFFVGSGTDEQKLRDKIKEYNLENEIILTGRISERYEISLYYKMADLFLFPSLYDCSSLVQIEAASQKTPSVFIKGAATAGTVTDDVNGYLSENSVENFAYKIEEIFADMTKYETVCENAYKDLYLTWDIAVENVYKDYLNIITKNKDKKGE